MRILQIPQLEINYFCLNCFAAKILHASDCCQKPQSGIYDKVDLFKNSMKGLLSWRKNTEKEEGQTNVHFQYS